MHRGPKMRANHQDETQSIVLDPAERTRCEVWSRCMGYHRPVSFWNPGKQQEHRDRRYFRVDVGQTGTGRISL
jgi:Anaerobic ribonucleoside-triphosphate reductase